MKPPVRTTFAAAPKPSPRELACLRLKANGLTDQGTARALGLALSTVKNHLGGLRARWGAASTAEAVYVACRNGYLP
jgi:DNA-binding NarL/FixJ family response regulator